MLSDTFSEGKLKDLRGSFPSDQPTELDDHGFLDDNDLEDVDDDGEAGLTTETPQPTTEEPETTPEGPKTPSMNPMFGSGFTSVFSPEIKPRLKSTDVVSSTRSTQPVDPGTHLGKGKVVVLRDISFVT